MSIHGKTIMIRVFNHLLNNFRNTSDSHRRRELMDAMHIVNALCLGISLD